VAKNVLPKHWNGSEFEELHIVTKASNVFTNDNKSVQQKIDDFTAHLADYTQHPYYAGDTSSTGTGILQITLPVTYSSWSAVPIGACFSFKNIYDNQTIASGIKLALAGLAGEKPILKPNGSLFTTLTKDAIYTVRWNGVNFILQGEGASGNATASDLLSGKTATTDAGEITGTMPNRGAVSHSLAINGTYTIPEGYHNGLGQVTQSIPTKGAATITPGTTNQVIAAGQYLAGAQTILGSPNLVPENIKSGVNIFGVVGTAPSGATLIDSGRKQGNPDDRVFSYRDINGKVLTPVTHPLPSTPSLMIVKYYYDGVYGTVTNLTGVDNKGAGVVISGNGFYVTMGSSAEDFDDYFDYWAYV